MTALNRNNMSNNETTSDNTNREFTRFVILLTKSTQPFSEPLVRRHVKYLKELDREKRLVLCGPFVDHKGGMVIIKAGSMEEARKIAASDPFVLEGAETFEIRTWLLSCEENHHLGMA